MPRISAVQYDEGHRPAVVLLRAQLSPQAERAKRNCGKATGRTSIDYNVPLNAFELEFV